MSGVHLLWKTILFGGNAFQHGMRFLWRMLGFVQLLRKRIKGFRMAEDDPMVLWWTIIFLISSQLNCQSNTKESLNLGEFPPIFSGFRFTRGRFLVAVTTGFLAFDCFKRSCWVRSNFWSKTLEEEFTVSISACLVLSVAPCGLRIRCQVLPGKCKEDLNDCECVM